MVNTLFSPISSLSITTGNRDLGFLTKSSFLRDSLPFSSSPFSHLGNPTFSRRYFKSPCAKSSSFDDVPKQFRAENLKDGLIDNFKNVPQYLYGLSPSQVEMLMTNDYPVHRMSEKVTEKSISSASDSLNNGEIYSVAGPVNRVNRGRSGRRRPPPDTASRLFDARIVYLGSPLYPSVTQLIVTEIMVLNYKSQTEPIYLYINCTGTMHDGDNIAEEVEAYAIADAMALSKADVYTVNVGVAFGQAAMLLSLGKKGHRVLQPNCLTELYLPTRAYSTVADVKDVWLEAKKLDADTDTFLKLLSKGTGKSKEELANDLKYSRFFPPKLAIEYGIADRIIEPNVSPEQSMLAKPKAQRMRGPGRGPGRVLPAPPVP